MCNSVVHGLIFVNILILVALSKGKSDNQLVFDVWRLTTMAGK
jgi:hypothetical protein